MKRRVLSGVDRIETVDHLLRGRRVGLMTAPCGITHNLKSTVDVVHERFKLSALFACEHGIRGDVQAGVEVPTQNDPETGVPVFSVYGKTKSMTDEMLDAFDVLLFDMQCVGVRFWTFLYSLSYAMQACAKLGKPVVVLDRLNPTGAHHVSGTVLDPAFASFVGNYALPTRHGLTIGEYALYVKDYLKLDLDLTVVPLSGYARNLYLDDTDTPWVAPSPNCATLHAALCYIGTAVFEGTNVSEGRGTTLPFEYVGAPFLNARDLEERMAKHQLPGLHFRRASFEPSFSKHQGKLCHGVQMHITNRETADAVLGALLLLDEIRAQTGDQFEFLSYKKDVFFIDSLLGTDAYRKGLAAKAFLEQQKPALEAYKSKVKAFHLYE